MAKVNPKVREYRANLVKELKKELVKIYESALVLAKDHRYRFTPSEKDPGWFDVIDGNDYVLTTICPVGLANPTAHCEKWAKTEIQYVKDIKDKNPEYYIPYEYSCKPITDQLKRLAEADKLQAQIDSSLKKIRDLEKEIKLERSNMQILEDQLRYL